MYQYVCIKDKFDGQLCDLRSGKRYECEKHGDTLIVSGNHGDLIRLSNNGQEFLQPLSFWYLLLSEETNEAVAITESFSPGEAITKIQDELNVAVPLRALTLNDEVSWIEERFSVNQSGRNNTIWLVSKPDHLTNEVHYEVKEEWFENVMRTWAENDSRNVDLDKKAYIKGRTTDLMDMLQNYGETDHEVYNNLFVIANEQKAILNSKEVQVSTK